MTPTRYVKVFEEIRKLKAHRLLEVGTWVGDRALEMIAAAIESAGRAVYYGFDLFEDITPEKSGEEFNVKRAAVKDQVTLRLQGSLAHKSASFYLYKGDTRETLPDFLSTHMPGIVDLAWIDGGHSVETIQSDWDYCRQLVRPGGVILLDDYYSEVPLATTWRFGCNRLVEKLKESENFQPEIFPERDPVKGGGFVQIVKAVIP